MMQIISERSSINEIKTYLDGNVTDQLWAKDVISEAVSSHYQNLETKNCSSMIMIGNPGTFLQIQSLWPDCSIELKEKYIHTKNIWFVGSIDCDIEGKLSRRFIQDSIELTVNRSNVIESKDLHSLGMLKELVEWFPFKAPFHCNDQQVLKSPMCQI
ncbi:unnamed protein product [Diamesa serratosioi]